MSILLSGENFFKKVLWKNFPFVYLIARELHNFIIFYIFPEWKVRQVVKKFLLEVKDINTCDINGKWEDIQVDSEVYVDTSSIKKLHISQYLSQRSANVNYLVQSFPVKQIPDGYLQAHLFKISGFPSFLLFEGRPREALETLVIFLGQSLTPIYDIGFGKKSLGSAFALQALKNGKRVFTPSLNGFGIASILAGMNRNYFLI